MSTAARHPPRRSAGDAARALEATFAGLPTNALIANLDTSLTFVEAGGVRIPVTLNDGESRTCYICCPSAAFTDYALEELRNFAPGSLTQRALRVLVRASSLLVAATRADRQAQPNNWLLSTNVWPGLPAEAVRDITQQCLNRWPTRVIVWRSFNDRMDAPLLEAFRAAGYRLIASRQVYVYDCRETLPERGADLARDMAMMRCQDYPVCGPQDIGEGDFARIAELYAMLYLEKYTPLNPQYTAEFMRRAHNTGLIEFHGVRAADGRLAGAIGLFAIGGVLTAPMVGYDTTLPQEHGLYRRLVALGMFLARERRMSYNLSAGAASFKRNRHAEAAIEYAAFYSAHLPFGARAATWAIEQTIQRIAVPVMRRFKL
ncbi:hypothetical protein LBMAG47_13500 [Planctomycetia bacterium]|nr:hypothetical protein LBMAG47_13500 [Planctomycetia bacterium]